MIERCGYWRRMEELEDAEAAAKGGGGGHDGRARGGFDKLGMTSGGMENGGSSLARRGERLFPGPRAYRSKNFNR